MVLGVNVETTYFFHLKKNYRGGKSESIWTYYLFHWVFNFDGFPKQPANWLIHNVKPVHLPTTLNVPPIMSKATGKMRGSRQEYNLSV